MKTCSDSIPLSGLENHFKGVHPAALNDLRNRLLLVLPSLLWTCPSCGLKTLKSMNHSCSLAPAQSNNNDIIDDCLHQIFAKCPRLDCEAEFNFSPTVWSQIDQHLSAEHEIHWLFFKKDYLKNFSTSRHLRKCTSNQLIRYVTPEPFNPPCAQS